jgi:ABC-2 type transport system ATP-binding protein
LYLDHIQRIYARGTPMIEAIGLTKRYGRAVAVHDLSFQAEPGKVTGFLGPNGAGKSTTLRMLLGLDHPDAGRALVDGQPYRSLARPLCSVGALLDASWVHPSHSARAHLRWLARSNRLPVSRVGAVLDLVGLADVADRRTGGFSLGMRQRLGIAAALLGDPPILIFDEPLNGLDPAGIAWLRQLMHRLADEGRTVFFSSHLLSEMALTASDLVVIGRGRLISQGPAAHFVDQAAQPGVRVRSPHLPELRAVLQADGQMIQDDDDALMVTDVSTEHVGRLAAANGITLYELSTQHGSLEHAFLRLTEQDVEFHAIEDPVPTSQGAP